MKTAVELEAESINIFGNDLGRAYYYLYSQISFLKIKWEEYKNIYHVNADQIEYLNKFAPFYFSLNQKILFNDILLHITKLTDKKSTCGKDNLSLLKLKSFFKVKPDNILIVQTIDDAMQKSSILIDWRNKYLAHFDFYVLTNQNNNILNEISIDEIENIINSVWKVIQCIANEYFSKNLSEKVIKPLGGTEIFLKKIKGEY